MREWGLVMRESGLKWMHRCQGVLKYWMVKRDFTTHTLEKRFHHGINWLRWQEWSIVEKDNSL